MSKEDANIFKFSSKIEVIKYLHRNQIRRFTIAPYWTHPVRVATLVMKYKESHEIDALVSAALFHDTLEDTELTIEKLTDMEGTLVSSLVVELTSDKKEIAVVGKTEYLKKKISDMSSWARIIKLCDRLDNISDFIYASKEFIVKYGRETADILKYLNENISLSETQHKIIEDTTKILYMYGISIY